MIRKLPALLLAALPSALAPSLVLAVALGNPDVVLLVFLFALAHAVIAGIPVAAVLMAAGRFRPLPMLVAGACVGLVPAALFFTASGEPGVAGYLLRLASMAGLGALGGLAFFLAHRVIEPG
jgi:hypothetical protein